MIKNKAFLQAIFQKSLALKAGETVLILSDGTEPELCRQLFDISHKFGAVTAVMQIKNIAGYDENNFYGKFLIIPAVVISVMADKLPHQWKKLIQKSKTTRVVEICAFDKKAQALIAETPYHRVNAISQKIKDILSIGHQMTITSIHGSELQLSPAKVCPRNYFCPIVKSGEAGELPAGKLCFDVKPMTGEGVLFIDGSISPLGAVSEPVRLKLNGGIIRRISGKKTAAELQYLFKKNGSVSRQLLTIGFGTNEAVDTDAIIEYGEHAAGNMSFTFGVPGNSDTPSHSIVRAVLLRPTVVIDGKTFLDEGRFMMSFHAVRTADSQHISSADKNF